MAPAAGVPGATPDDPRAPAPPVASGGAAVPRGDRRSRNPTRPAGPARRRLPARLAHRREPHPPYRTGPTAAFARSRPTAKIGPIPTPQAPPQAAVLRPRTAATLLAPLAFAAFAAAFGPGFARAGDGSPAKPGAPAEPEPTAEQILAAARGKLDGYRTVRATLTQRVNFGTAKFAAAGTFLSAGGGRVRLTLDADAAGDHAQILQVCDGEVLHTQYRIGETTRATRRNVRTVRQAAAGLPDPNLAADLGLGGLSGLLASLQTGMKWRAPARQRVGGREFLVLDGRWNRRSRQGLKDRYGADLPDFVPIGVKLYLDADRLFPHRFHYWRKGETETAGRVTLLSLDLSEVSVNGPVPPDAFAYALPEDADEDDVTLIALDRLAPADDEDDSDDGNDGDAGAIEEETE